MKKKTLNALLLAFNICMAFAIVILIVLIAKRGPKPMEEYKAQEQSIAEQIAAEQAGQDSVSGGQIESQQTTSTSLVCVPTSASSVNVRTGPSTDYQRIGSAYMENNYEVLAILDNGWTKILYDGQTGYISSEYVRYQVKTIYNDNEDAASFLDASEDEIREYMKADDNAPAPPVIEESTEQEVQSTENTQQETQETVQEAPQESADEAIANIIADQEEQND